MLILGFIALILLLAGNAFFVAAEFAIVSVDPTRLAERVRTGDRRAAIAESFVNRLSFSLSGVQLGITLCSLAMGVLAEPVVAELIEPVVGGIVGDHIALGVSVAIAIAVTAVAQMIVGEIIPKSVAVARPMDTARHTARAFGFFMSMFRPLITVSDSLAKRIVRALGIEPAEVLTSVRTREELRRLLDSSVESGSIDATEAALLTKTFAFAHKCAADALTPRVSVKALNSDDDVDTLIALSKQTGLSRFPIIGEHLDDVIGVVHIKDVLSIPPADRSGYPLAKMLRPVLAVPESKGLEPLMLELQRADGQFAVVVDEYGGTAGIITLEDLIEEIVGDISDEHDRREATPSIRRWQGAHLLSGQLHVGEVADACGLDLPDGDFETLAGFVLQQLGRIPSVHDEFDYQGWHVEVTRMDGHRIVTVKLVAPSPGAISDEPGGRS